MKYFLITNLTMQKKKPKPAGTGGLYLPLNQKLIPVLPKHTRQALSTMLAIIRGADTPRPNDNVIPRIEDVEKAIEVVNKETAKLIADLEAIKKNLIDFPPERKSVGRPKGSFKKKI